MMKELAKVKRSLKARGYCAAYVVTAAAGVNHMNVTEVTTDAIIGHNYGTRRDEIIALTNVTNITVLG